MTPENIEMQTYEVKLPVGVTDNLRVLLNLGENSTDSEVLMVAYGQLMCYLPVSNIQRETLERIKREKAA